MIDPASLTFAKVAKFIGIRGGIAIAFALALAGTATVLHFVDADRDKWRRTAHQTEVKLEVSNASIADLKESLAVFVGAGKAARVAQLAAIEAQAEKSAAYRAQADAIEAMIAEFEPGDPCDCSTPELP
ncbi:MAG: hypothetical protein CL955_06895 [Erythrobacteraceae bacterium]|nr:hypothetical protein [Erythrobacteraceae bacterium]|tara:strand:+ start:1366 stop:1752 length:387 start_codon:yes stop_codon:yes gene_type:complete